MTKVPARCTFIFLASDRDDVMEQTRAAVTDFLVRNGPEARVVSFCEATRLKLPEMEEISFWRDIISDAQEAVLQKAAHERLQRMVLDSEQAQETVLLCNWPLVFFYMFQCVLIEDLLAHQDGPLCLILSGGGSKGDFFEVEGDAGGPVPSSGLRMDLQPVDMRVLDAEPEETDRGGWHHRNGPGVTERNETWWWWRTPGASSTSIRPLPFAPN